MQLVLGVNVATAEVHLFKSLLSLDNLSTRDSTTLCVVHLSSFYFVLLSRFTISQLVIVFSVCVDFGTNINAYKLFP